MASKKNVLISGASIAGLSMAWWMHRLGYEVTVMEMAAALRKGGAAVDIRDNTVDTARRMGIFGQLQSERLHVRSWEFKDSADRTIKTLELPTEEERGEGGDIEIERDRLVRILYDSVQTDVELVFGERIAHLEEKDDCMVVQFQNAAPRTFDLVIGCDGMHSGVRKLWFEGAENYMQFMKHYFSLTIVRKLLVPEASLQMYNVPGKVAMLNAYRGKTDIVLCFHSEREIPYDYRDTEGQKEIIREQFAGRGWRTDELLEEVQRAELSYFDKFCQVKMPSWTKGRVALVGDAAYCASPAAGMGASLAMEGAATLADALARNGEDYARAFAEYEAQLRPFIEGVQEEAQVMLDTMLIPKTQVEIEARYAEGSPFE